MPEIDSTVNDAPQVTESKETMINRLVAQGLDGNMDEINSLDDKVLEENQGCYS